MPLPEFLGFKFELTGVDQLEAEFADRIDEMRRAAGKALYIEATDIIAESKKIVPVLWHTLQQSGHVGPIVIDGNRVEVTMGYGGAAAAYSIVQHETPPEVFSHAPGRTYKYLQRPFFAAARGMSARIAARIRSELGAT